MKNCATTKHITVKPSDIMVEYKIEPEVHEPSEYERALLSINRAYDAEDYDLYEARIERAARKFDKSYNQVEDDATDVRLLGIDGN